MFAPRVAKPKMKSAEPRHSAVLAHRPGLAAVTQGQLLQRTIGNQAMLRLPVQRVSAASNAPGPIQAKLKVGSVNDPLEHEADRVADQVMRMPAPEISVAAAPPLVSRKCAHCEEEKLQRKSAGPQVAGSEAPASVHEVLRSPGRPLDTETRGFFEPRFRRDLSDVRVHTDAAAERSAQAINAHAYTAGNNMVFGPDQFAPGTQAGRRLLAHELTHVVQQSGSGVVSAGRSGSLSRTLGRSSENAIMRKGFESTIEICHRVLETRNFEIANGGLRVVLIPKKLDENVPNCKDFDFSVTLTESKNWWPDDEIGTCRASTGGTRSFSFAKLTSGTYYLTIARNFDHPFCCLEGDILVFDEKVSDDSEGCTRDEDPSVMDIVHGALDIAGFVPILGAVPDGLNAGIYVVEGDWISAGLSAVAAVPFWGDGIKLETMAGKSVIKVSEKAAMKSGKEGLAKTLKEMKAVSKVTHATEDAAKVGTKIEKEAAEKLEKEAAEKLEKEAAKKALREKVAECEAIWAAYKALNCPSCKASDTVAERAAKIACLTALLAGRRSYLKKKCDYVLPGSIARGSALAEKGHETAADQVTKQLLKCSTLPTVK